MNIYWKKIVFVLFFVIVEKNYAGEQIQTQYDHVCKTPSDIRGHIPVLCKLAKECSSVIEIGMRGMVSSWGIFKGLSENPSEYRSYLGIDIALPPIKTIALAKKIMKECQVEFTVWVESDMDVDIPSAELLFIDSLHTYCHLTYELEKFSPKISKYIAMHDTSEPWGDCDDSEYKGDYSEYPAFIDRTKRGLYPAVEDFLLRHPEWILHERYYNDHGFTILKRVL